MNDALRVAYFLGMVAALVGFAILYHAPGSLPAHRAEAFGWGFAWALGGASLAWWSHRRLNGGRRGARRRAP